MNEDVAVELQKVIDDLLREAQYWQDHPDYFTLRKQGWPEGNTYKESMAEFKAWIAEHGHQQRATHTDIVLRQLANDLARCLGALGGTLRWNDSEYEFVKKEPK